MSTIKERTVTATEANRRFSAILRGVRRGHCYTITSHGERVAELRPAGAETPAGEAARRRRAWAELKRRLRSQPVLNLPRVTRDEMHER